MLLCFRSMSRAPLILVVLCSALGACAASTESPPADSQVAAADTGDGGPARDSGVVDTSIDSNVDTNAVVDDSVAEATTDTAIADTSTADTAPADTAPADPCSPLPSGLTTWTKTDSASVGTPDTYFFDVTPGDPFCATITGGGGGAWSVNVSNGTSSGVYCSGSPTCSIVVPAGQMTLLATAVTTDIGGYTLTVRYRPR